MKLSIMVTVFFLTFMPLGVFGYGGDDFVRFDATDSGKKFSMDDIKHIQEKTVDSERSCIDRTNFESLVLDNIQLAIYSLIELQKYNPDEKCSIYSTRSETLYIFSKEQDNYKLIGRIFGGDGNFELVDLLILKDKQGDSSIPVLVTEFIVSGTGHISHFKAFRVTTSSELHEIRTNLNDKDLPLHKGQGFGKGPFYRVENNNKLYMTGYVTNEGDGGCCPTGGQIDVGLILIRDQGKYMLEYDLNDITAPSESNRLNQLGLKNYRENNFDQSIYYFNRAIHFNKENFEAHSNLSLAYYRAEKYKDSIKSAMMVISSNKSSQVQKASAYYNVGKSYEKMGDYRNALVFYRKSVELKPNQARKDAVNRVKEKIH